MVGGVLYLQRGLYPSLIVRGMRRLRAVDVLFGFVALSLRDVGVGFEEPHLRPMFYFVESGFPRFFPYFCIDGSSEWTSVTVLP